MSEPKFFYYFLHSKLRLDRDIVISFLSSLLVMLEFNLSDTHDEVTDFNYFEAERFATNTKLNVINETSSFALSNKIIIEISNVVFSKK